jgi:hypothetical protein
MAMVPFGWMEMAGSLSPSSRSSGVLEKLIAPFTVPSTLEALTYVAGTVTATRAIAAAAKVSITAVAIRRCERALFRVNHRRVFICFGAAENELNFGEFAEFGDSSNEDENGDQFGCFFYFFPGSVLGSQLICTSKTAPGEAAMSLRSSKVDVVNC